MASPTWWGAYPRTRSSRLTAPLRAIRSPARTARQPCGTTPPTTASVGTYPTRGSTRASPAQWPEVADKPALLSCRAKYELHSSRPATHENTARLNADQDSQANARGHDVLGLGSLKIAPTNS